MITRRETCRLCDSSSVERVVKLEPIPLSEQYAASSEAGKQAPRYPVDVYMCTACGHVQQLDVIDSASLWAGYTYYSGQAVGMAQHFRDVAAKVRATCQPPKGSLVVDIGSNDGSLLLPFKEAGHRVLGIDPAREIAAQATRAGIETIPEVISLRLARELRERHGAAHVVCMFNAFAHADDLGEVADSIRTLLAPDGVFVFEAQYLLDVIDGVLIATIFHEHMSHHSVKPLIGFLERHGLELIAVERAPIQHGSLIGTVQLKGGKRPVERSVGELLALEARRRLDQVETLREFDRKVAGLRSRVSGLAREWKANGSSVAAYGAARSGPTLISQLGLQGAIEYILDDHPQKVGRYSSGDGLLIVPTAELLKRMPQFTVILAWVHAAKIIAANQAYLDKGGHFVVLCPDVRVV